MSLLSLQQVRYAFPGWPPTVDGANLDVGEGAFHCLVGRSGCGKTTLLKLAAGLLAPDSGQVVFRSGRPGPRPGIGFVFQSPNLLEWLRVIDNVLLPVTLHGRPAPAQVRRAHELLAQLGLAAHARKYPRQLSGGQQSRVALARALVLQPALLLLDEPFAALDALTRLTMQRLVGELCRRHQPAVLLVTHDVEEAILLADRIVVLGNGRTELDVRVSGDAVRHRGDPEFLSLRSRLLDVLGVPAAA